MQAGWKNMLLHIFRLEEGAAEAAGIKASERKSRGACEDGSRT
jgi:hypothetical protein